MGGRWRGWGGGGGVGVGGGGGVGGGEAGGGGGLLPLQIRRSRVYHGEEYLLAAYRQPAFDC